jgi:mono/diheme cytochrome c family protein
MKRSVLIFSAVLPMLLAVAVSRAAAQPAAASRNASELAGRNLFAQHCVVCHVKTLVTAVRTYGPPLSKDSLGGQPALLRAQISDGSPNMPGFKYSLEPPEIDAIVAYLQTLPAPAPAPPIGPAPR